MRFKLPPKYKVYDYLMLTGNLTMFGITVVLAGFSFYRMVHFKTTRVPEIEEEVRLFKEAQLMKEQVERESMLMRNKQNETEKK